MSLDAVTRGLGNASCGPDVMDKYELKAANTAFRFIIIPLSNEVKAANKARANMPVCQPVSCERLANGRIRMTTPTKNATIYYSINGEPYQKYSTVLTHNDACTVKAYCCLEGLMDSPVMSYHFDMFINKSNWKLVSVDSQHGGNEARLAFDGNNNTFWHTEYQGSEPTCPHTLIVDMGIPYWVTAFTYLARQDGNQNGMVKAYEVYLSNDGKTWGTPVVSGEFKNTTALQIAKLNTTTMGRLSLLLSRKSMVGLGHQQLRLAFKLKAMLRPLTYPRQHRHHSQVIMTCKVDDSITFPTERASIYKTGKRYCINWSISYE